ncbi:uncharacterized protein PADG_04548 [Paracoccidioides brasiliensis Pb18]|uniref:Uncharacterized protein n=1 Tax=Paracoccidioides brasiliensis (strain Pb18) TaxID=502780 RepID=C1GC26_PARBD|nr:uncharacterized protein PADG_04548 [Paracoccidioides brasiliensis Pb18]EEH48468.2 hypothetical protein PADG_04548 [Paracoccidioides brasiliensis Pb18]
MGSPEDYHGTLTKFLAARNNQIYDIHFLPEGFGDLLHEGAEIGISKKALVQCFIKARQIFFSLPPQQPRLKETTEQSQSQSHLSKPNSSQGCNAPETPIQQGNPFQPPPSANPNPSLNDDFSSQTLLLQTEILLLVDSEHLTACNWRKRRLCALKEAQSQCTPNSTSNPSINQYLSVLHTEISFTTTILRSPLHRHTKSPVLWYHRKWTITQLFNICPDNPISVFAGSHHLPHYDADGGVAKLEFPPSIDVAAAVNQILNYEISVVLQAGTHHPKNYYAFSYLREFLGLFADALGLARWPAGATIQQPILLCHLARMAVESVHSWCMTYSHRRDISAWSFLLWLLEAVGDDDDDDVRILREVVVEKTARLGMDVRWDGEGLWIFVDLAAGSFGIDVDWVMGGGSPSRGSEQRSSSVGGGPVDIDGVAVAMSVSSTSDKRWKRWVGRIKAA